MLDTECRLLQVKFDEGSATVAFLCCATVMPVLMEY